MPSFVCPHIRVLEVHPIQSMFLWIEFVGAAEVGVLEDAIVAQHIDRVAALLEHGLSPDGERGSSKVGRLCTSMVDRLVVESRSINAGMTI